MIISRLKAAGLLSAGTGPYSAVLELTEHQDLVLDLQRLPDPTETAAVLSAFEPALAKRLFSLNFGQDVQGRAEVHVKTSSVVGFASVAQGDTAPVFVRVSPKVPTQRFLELVSLAGMLPKWHGEDIKVGEDSTSPQLEWALRAFDVAVQKLLDAGGVRSTHERINRDLAAMVRGRVRLGAFVHNLAKGRPDRIPCEYASLELDNEPNRFLRWALRVAGRLATVLQGTHHLQEKFIRAERMFAEAKLAPPRNGTVLTVESLPPGMRHYAEPIRIAQYILDNVGFQPSPGELPLPTIAVDMNDVYEKAFDAALQELVPGAASQTVWAVALTAGAGQGRVRRVRLIPDIYITSRTSCCPIVIDTKWKDTLADLSAEDVLLSEGETKTVRLRTADYHQIVSYAIECLRRDSGGHRTCMAALVYPSLNLVPDLGIELLVADIRIHVRLMAWNLSHPPRSGVATVWSSLKAIAASSGAGPLAPDS